MFVATPTHRSLKNPSTGIDITVPAVLEVEAPLGGTTTEYEISILTNLSSYKTKLHKDDDVVHFTVQKAYREMEDFYDKIAKKYSNLSLPSIPRGRSTLQYSSEDKRASLDQLMKHVAATKEISHSTLFQQFIGINKLKKQCLTSVASEDHVDQEIISTAVEDTLDNKAKESSNQKDPLNADDDISELFPKMKVRKSSQSNSIKEEDFNTTQPSLAENEKISVTEELDLFEEVKQIKEVKNKETQLFSSDAPHHGLFEYSEDDTNLFRVNSPTPVKNNTLVSDRTKLQTAKEVKNIEKPISKDTTDSEEIFSFSRKEEKISPDSFSQKENLDFDEKNSENIFLFGEQDLGCSITKEDEALFYIPKSESKISNANPFLSPSSESTEENDIEESIEELTSLIEPSASLAPKHEEIKKVPKPETRPPPPQAEKFSLELSKTPPVSEMISRRESLPKPPLPPKPSVPPKPKPTAKPPVPAKKPTMKPPVADKGGKATDNVAQNLSPIDIMQYIEQEQKLASAETSLFD